MRKCTMNVFMAIVFLLPAMFAFSQGKMHEIPKENVCLMKGYQAIPLESAKSFFTEDFSSGTFPPAGWTIVGDGQDNWLEGASNNAGGVAPEAYITWSPQFVGTSRLVTSEIATSAYASLLFEMKHYVSHYGLGYTLKVETTSDGGTTWNEVWAVTPDASIGPETLQLLIDNDDVGSDNFQLAFTLDGDSYQINQWYFDDIILSEALSYDAAVTYIDIPTLLSTGVNVDPGATVTNYGSETATFDVTFEILDGGSAIYSEVVTVTDLGSFESEVVTYPTWAAVEGTFTVEVTADLTGDENPDNDMMSVDIIVESGLVNRKPLYEEFTSSTCAPCVPANEVIAAVLGANPDEYTLIKYQMNWPGSGDPYYTEEGGARKDYYGCSWVPDLYIVGEQLDPAASLTQEIFDSYANALTALEIEITEAAIDEDLIITVSADLTPLASYAAGLTAHMVVIEKLTVGNVGSNGETEWHNVMMKMLPDASGTTLDALTTGVQVTLSETYNMDETNMETPNDLAVVVFVQDDTDKSIVQSAVMDVEGTFASYNVDITVEDEEGNPIEGAEVMLEGNGTKTTDATGVVLYEGVFPGTYAFDVEAAGFFPNSGSVTVIDQDVSATIALEAPEFYWFEMFDVEPTDWTYHFSGWDYVYWYDGRMILFRQSSTTEPLMLVSPAIDIDPANKIMFDLGEQGNMPAIVEFGTMTDPADPATFTLLETYEALPDWQTFEYDLSNSSNIETDVYFAWSLPSADGCFFSLDNVILTAGATSQYCEATTTNEDEYITDVICGDINNLGTGWQGGVADYTDQTTSIPAGGSEDIVVNNGNAWSSDIVYAWVDWNMDYEFGVGTDEEFMLENVGGTGETFTGAIMPPAGTPEGDYRMRVRMTYSTAPLPCDNASYGEVEDYTITVGEGTTPTATCEDFDALTPGDYVALELGGNWTTWSGTPGTAEDGLVSDMYSLSPSNSVLVEGTTDLVHLITGDNITSGMWSYSLNIYVPDGTTGYFNLQKDVVPGTEWGFQVMFEDDMTMIVDGGAAAAAVIPYNYDQWYFCEMIVDLDNDWCEFYVDDNLELGYQWTLGTFGTAGALTLAGSNIYANPGAGGTPPGAHFDDICFEEIAGAPTARVQAIHNSADAAAEVVDVWLDDILLLDNFTFRTASPFVDAPAGVEFTLAVKGPDSTNPDDPIWSQNYTLAEGETYVLVAEGIVSPTGYTPPTPFDIAVYPMGREEASMSTNTDVLVNHGSTDAPTVDVYEIGVGAGEIIDDLSYFEFAGYLELGTLDYILDVRDETGTTSVAAYQAPLATLGLDGAAITVVASGFLDPSVNSDGPGFGLWVALASGGPLVELPLYVEGTCEDFDELTPGDYVALELGGNWTTWTGAPGTAEDAIVSDAVSLSPDNSILVEGTTDLVHLISGDNLTEGKWSYSLNIYVPTGTTGYFNLQKDVVPGTEWGFQVMFEDDMTMVVDGGAAGAAIIPYNYDQWYFCEMIVDLDNDWCQFFVDDNLELEYQWTLGTFGTAGALTLAGSNIYANPGAGGTPPGAHFDDICFEELPNVVYEMPMNVMAEVQNDVDALVTWDAPASGTPTGYDVYRNDDFLANVTALEYLDEGLEVGTYIYCVVAVYADGESLPACADPVTIEEQVPPGPINLTGDDEVTTGNPINLMWEAPGGGEWIHWDAGVNNGNGIGLTDGGTFDCASHWYPSDLGPYNGLSLTTITFFANGDPDATYVLKVWTGANGTTEVHSQDVASFNVDEWNEVALTTPVVISSADDFWFGYEVTHGAGMFPAGTDDGPAVPYNGDMIATGGAWVSMSTDYGLDYNWNIQGWVELADGKGATLTTKLVKPVATSTNFAANGSTGVSSKFVPTADNSKDLESYNVYRSINGGAFTVIGNTPDTEYTDEDVTVSGTYEYEVTAVWDPGGESDPSNVHTVGVLTGIEEMLFNSTLVYPNPASEVVNIKSDFDITSIKVFNHSGQVIADEMVHNKMYQFNTSQYNAGMYFFQIETSEGTISKRIIVQ